MSELLDKILARENMNRAYKHVTAKKSSAGIDGITVDNAFDYIKENWTRIEEEIRTRKYKPTPVKRIVIPKPNGRKRNLGVPSVMDRIIQQAMVQVLSPICEVYFSENSYGFRPGRSCEMAIMKLLEYFNEGFIWIVDIDLEKFFDNVPQDKLMSYAHEIINDGDVESLIRRYLQAGVMENGAYQETNEGTVQGNPISPLLSNIMLNKLDKELEARNLRFTRYADDVVIVTKSKASANRVMHSITKWIERKLGLKVNATKTKITTPTKLKYLGFGFYYNNAQKAYKSRPHQESIQSFKRKLKQLTIRKYSMTVSDRIRQLNQKIRGWVNYFSICDMKTAMKEIDAHLRTRLRAIIWKQWKVPSKRQWGLQKLGIGKDLARLTSYLGNRYQWIATKTCVVRAISKRILAKKGLISCLDYYILRHNLKIKTNRLVPNGMLGGVRG